MEGNKNYFHQLKLKSFLGFLILLLFQSCIPTAENNLGARNSTSANITTEETTQKPDPKPSTFSNSVNFFQSGTQKSATNFQLDINTENSLFLRGPDINSFLTNSDRNLNSCIVFKFSTDDVKKVLIVAGLPLSKRDFTNNSIEHYYSLLPSDESQNKSLCQSSNLISRVFSENIGHQIVFKITDVCVDCLNTSTKSSNIQVLTKEGRDIQDISDHYLSIQLISKPVSEIIMGNSCQTSAECTAKGFDCCSLGQCVNDKTPKPGVAEIDPVTGELINFSAQYSQVAADIKDFPSHIYNYPHLFYLCAQNQMFENVNVDQINEEEDAYLRFRELQDLYNCTTLTQGEESICVQRYIAPTTKNIPLLTGKDDLTFEDTYSGSHGMPNHSITKIIHAEQVLFENNEIKIPNTVGINGDAGQVNRGNNNFDDVVTITLNNPIPINSDRVDEIAIYYRTDGSCEKLNAYLAKCKKYYIQGQNIGETNDHYPASNYFRLPYYADFSRLININVDNVPQIDTINWERDDTLDQTIRFFQISPITGLKNSSNLVVFDGQLIEIEYFVDLNQHNVGTSKYEALDRIDQICQCGGPYCRLREVYSNSTPKKIVDYACVYPEKENSLKFEQKVIVSSKSVPQRYFDEEGLGHETISVLTPKQEESNRNSINFKYTNGDPIKPNNVNQYIGFNEINGAIGYQSSMAKPPTVVHIEKGTTYDIFVDQGTFNTCISCGQDYYSQFIKIFPDSFINRGAGYQSKGTETDPFSGTDYRMDDLLFGRACFVPATMIPFTHSDDSTAIEQRYSRQAAQHFLHANGYQRDWYGFDYGSIIGSFDGVTWFSIGNQRRIKADSHRLYLAVNTFYGDLNRSNIFVVHISEASLIVGAGSQITSDENSDGTSCRQFHQCEVDQDCVSQLGWDYVCEDISLLKTRWPSFNSYGQELPTNDPPLQLFSNIFYGTEKGNRCVYRGRGAPCEISTAKEEDSTYSGIKVTNSYGLHFCAPNYHCAEIKDNKFFNNKISRYARSPAYQNASTDVPEEDLDLIGKGARILGRPFSYNGSEEISSTEGLQNLKNNNVNSICIPGKEPRMFDFDGEPSNFTEQNKFHPTTNGLDGRETFMGDQINGIGMSTESTIIDPNFVMSCGIFDFDGDYYYKKFPNAGFDAEMQRESIKQATSTNLLKIFENPDLTDTNMIKNFDQEQIDQFYYQKNRCLRMPGSVCFSDLDCVANKKIVDVTQVISTETDDTLDGDGNLNRFEVDFWQTELICGQRTPKDHEDYELKNNRCCRDHLKTFKWAQEEINRNLVSSNNIEETTYRTAESPFIDRKKIPGYDLELNDFERLTSNAFNVDFFNDNLSHHGAFYTSTEFFKDGECVCHSSNIASCTDLENADNLNQWKLLGNIGRKMCCSQNWIRQFNEENGGGHEWTVDRNQLIPSENFKQINWLKMGDRVGESSLMFTCKGLSGPTDSACLQRGLSREMLDDYEHFLSRFDYLGIPQMPINSFSNPATSVIVDENQDDASGPYVIPGTINENFNRNNASFKNGTEYYFSADNDTDFWAEGNSFRKIFAKEDFTCCLPPNSVLEKNGNPSQCCSGYAEDINVQGKLERTCKLRDFTDISQLLNKYVSSLGEELGLEDSVFDPITGDLDHSKYSFSNLTKLICQADICGSGAISRGVASNLYNVPGFESDDTKRYRFIQGEDEPQVGGFYEAGLKWYTHLYCFPMKRNTNTTTGATQSTCTTQGTVPPQMDVILCDCLQ